MLFNVFLRKGSRGNALIFNVQFHWVLEEFCWVEILESIPLINSGISWFRGFQTGVYREYLGVETFKEKLVCKMENK